VHLFDLLAETAARTPARPALRAGSRSSTYGETLQQAAALAAALQARGVGEGDRVATLLPNTSEHFLAYFAAAGAGAILVPLNLRLSADELRAIAADASPRLLLHDDSTAAAAEAIAGAFADGAHRTAALLAAGDATAFRRRGEGGDAVAQLYYTSGTTGRPKGVMLSHRNVGTHAANAVRELGLCAADRWAHVAPMFHLADAWATFAISMVGGEHAFLPRFTPLAALDLLEQERITITNLVPTMLNLMVKEPSAKARAFALRAMLSGGAPIAPEVVRQLVATFRCDYVQTYGMTETSPYLTLSLLDDEQRRLPQEEQLRIKSRTGRPFLGVELEVVDEQGRHVPRDDRTVGEIRVRGATVMRGYWRDPMATAAAFDADGFLRTGDLATIDASGSVAIVDRKKDVIKTGGETVYSTEVENVLYRHAAVLECAVYGVPDEVWGERVSAAVVLRPGHAATADELLAHCRAAIAHYKAPRALRFLDALPKTGSGKIQKRTLRGLP
jgi:acyl-CoA synthetase (AMP-forming)/AMP-acid ligase II